MKRGKNHGLSRTKVYRTWRHIKSRCFNPNVERFKNYGGRGIKMCEKWANDFFSFLMDIGEPPSPKHTIDRIDNNGNYEPGNCRWVLDTVQRYNRTNNRRITVDGKTKTLTEWCKESGLDPDTAARRIDVYGWDEKSAVTFPVQKLRRKNNV